MTSSSSSSGVLTWSTVILLLMTLCEHNKVVAGVSESNQTTTLRVNMSTPKTANTTTMAVSMSTNVLENIGSLPDLIRKRLNGWADSLVENVQKIPGLKFILGGFNNAGTDGVGQVEVTTLVTEEQESGNSVTTKGPGTQDKEEEEEEGET